MKRIRLAYERQLGGLIGEVKGASEAPAGLDVDYATYFTFGALNGLPTCTGAEAPTRPGRSPTATPS